MIKRMKASQKFIIYLAFIFLFVLMTAIAIHSCVQSVDLSIGGSNNMQMLNELNEKWELDEEYIIETMQIDGIELEWLRRKNEVPKKAILQLHGGAYIRTLNYRENLYQRMAEQYAVVSRAGVLTVDYRVAPDNPYPAALEDAILAYHCLLDMGYNEQDIIVSGDSAGGGLALALVLYLRDNQFELPCAVITMSAWTNLNYRKKPAYVGEHDAKNPYISPQYGNYEGFPPMLMQVGTKDIKKNTTIVAQKANESGVSVRQTIYNRMPHVFQALFPKVEEANMAWNEVSDFLANII